MPGLQPDRCARPARHRARRAAITISSANSRSGARKSLENSAASACTATTSVMRRKSWPLATICVPTSTSISPSCTCASWLSRLPLWRWCRRRCGRCARRAAARRSAPSRSVPRPASAAGPGRRSSGRRRARARRSRSGDSAACGRCGGRPGGAAMRAVALPAAGGAVQHRRIAAAVQQHQALLAAHQALAHRLDQGAAPAAANRPRA